MKRDAPLRILVTGGEGFIGSAMILHLLRDSSHIVHSYDARTYAAVPGSLDAVSGHDRLSLEAGDIGDADTIARVLETFAPDVVVNLAAETHVDRSIDGPDPFVRTNVAGTVTLLDQVTTWWRRKGRPDGFRFHHVSTDEVFGTLGPTGQFDEASPYDPRSPYSASKAAADHFVRAWAHTYGLPILITNCSNNYGPRQHPEKLIPTLILNALAGRQLPLYGDGLQVRDWLHVEDHARALRTVFERGVVGRTYLIGGEGERTNREIALAVCRALDRQAPRPDGKSHEAAIRTVTDRPGHDRRYGVNSRRVRGELGWSPRISLEAGLDEVVRWYLANADWVSRATGGGEGQPRRGLPI